MDAETAHGRMLGMLSFLPAAGPRKPDPVLALQFAGLNFPNPIGVAAGFDKDAQAAHAMPRLGFGFAEVGTLTPLPQSGNPKPRLFRLAEDHAVINRMGFNNQGVAVAHDRLAKLREKGQHGIIGVNIGANKDSADRIEDYVTAFAAMADVADYITVNISSPNTPGLRALQDANALDDLLDAVLGLRKQPRYARPVFLKVAPDLLPDDLEALAKICIDRGIDAIIIGNTTLSRPPLASRYAGEAGGLSGAPLRDLALARLRDFRRVTGEQMPLIAAGGIASADDAYARIRAGASLIQIYSALVYEGPGLAARIATGLKKLLAQDGFATLSDAVGSDFH